MMDHGYNKPSPTSVGGSDAEADGHAHASSSASAQSISSGDEGRSGSPTKKVFTNWGGEFFKKNLDYRANTNKILEKMNLAVTPQQPPPQQTVAQRDSNGLAASREGFKALGSSSAKRPFVQLASAASAASTNSQLSPVKKLNSGGGSGSSLSAWM
jgi:hypothetical protein